MTTSADPRTLEFASPHKFVSVLEQLWDYFFPPVAVPATVSDDSENHSLVSREHELDVLAHCPMWDAEAMAERSWGQTLLASVAAALPMDSLLPVTVATRVNAALQPESSHVLGLKVLKVLKLLSISILVRANGLLYGLHCQLQ